MRLRLALPLVLVLALLAAPGALGGPDDAAAPKLRVLADEADLTIEGIETDCNTYLVTDKATGDFVVVDPAPVAVGLVEEKTKRGRKLTAVWITHEHGDHVMGLGALARKVSVPIVAHRQARKHIAHARENWHEWNWNDAAPIPPVLPDTLVSDGATLKVGELAWKVLYVPGHSPGSICFLLPGRHLLCGDVLFKGAVGRTDLPTSDLVVYRRALSEKLWDLPDEVRAYPGHMEETTIGAEKASNWSFQDYVRVARGEEPIPRPWMGIRLNPEREEKGVELTQVVDGSPAAKAGLKVGDVITSFDGVELEGPREFLGVIRSHGIGDAVPIQVLRDGEPVEMTFTFGARPPR